LSVAIIGVFSAFSIVTILTSDTADRLTGTYLAQEGMEIVRNIRDTNWLKMDANPSSGYTWVDGLTSASVSQSINCVQGCEADYTTGTSVAGAWTMSPWAGSGSPLYTNNTTGFYGYNTTNATRTKFERKIIITLVPDVDGITDTNMSDTPHVHIIKVIVQASWNEKATILNPLFPAGTCIEGKNCITAEETMYDWYNYSSQQQ